VRECYPTVYQWVRERVKPERDENKRATYRDNWWLFGEPRKEWREMSLGLHRYISTVVTQKHRFFIALESTVLPDDALINIATESYSVLGVLSSRIHFIWMLVTGGTLEDRPRYIKTRCFETFPFPILSEQQVAEIGKLAERIDAHRKQQQALHSELTLTGMYNVLEKLRAGDDLNDKERVINQHGLVSTLLEDHDKLDRAVFKAYGWPDLESKLVGRPGATTPLPDKPTDQVEAEEQLLMRLVALNKQRAVEEVQGKVRWLRPAYQAPDSTQVGVDLITEKDEVRKTTAPAAKGKVVFPKSLPEQLKVLRETLAERPHTVESLAELFKRKPRKSVEEGLLSLAALKLAEYEQETDTWYTTG
jgi:hypothetical protein